MRAPSCPKIGASSVTNLQTAWIVEGRLCPGSKGVADAQILDQLKDVGVLVPGGSWQFDIRAVRARRAHAGEGRSRHAQVLDQLEDVGILVPDSNW